MKLTVKLQGGPCDGMVRRVVVAEPPSRLWAARCPECGAHVYVEEVPKTEIYRRDQKLGDRRWLYVFTDPNLTAPPVAEVQSKVPEKAAA